MSNTKTRMGISSQDEDAHRRWRLFALALQGDTRRVDKLAQHFATPEDYLDAAPSERCIRYAYDTVQLICGDLDLIEIDEIVQRVGEDTTDG